MKTLLITTAFLTAPMVSTVSAQSSDALKRQIAEQNRQIVDLEGQVSSLQSQLNLERKRNGKKALPTKTTTSTISTRYHVVKSGDTFSSIARKNGVSLASLIAANKGVSPNKIAINQKLVIPQNTATAKTTPTKAKPKTTVKNTPKPAAKGTYTVQKGDTLYGIARKNNITVSKLIAMNPKVKPTKIKPGQKLSLTGNSKVVATSKVKTKPAATTPKPASKPKLASKPAPKPTAKSTPKPTTSPIKHAEPTNVAKTVTVTSVMTYGQFASKNGTTISVLNAMNGLDLPSDEPMAVGSALYVPTK